MFDIIPSHLSGFTYNDGGAFSQNMLLIGEVQAIYYPDDPANVSKRTTEYDVLVGLRVNGTAVTKMFTHVTATDSFGGVADTFTKTFRPDTSAKRTGSNKKVGEGLGSKVLMLSINGENLNTVIIGGVRDSKTAPEKNLGHRMHFVFNGVEAEINDAGELTLQVHGKTDSEGKTAEEVGSSVKISKDGNVAVTTKDCSLVIDQAAGKVSVTAKNDVIVDSPKIHLGSAGATERGVKGDSWKGMMTRLLQALMKLTVYSPVGPTSPPINTPEFAAILAQLETQLSKVVTLE